MMSKTSVDTRATTYQFRSNMSYLENYMETIGSNIELFNLHVKNSRDGWNAQTIQLLSSRYRLKFEEYIETKEEIYLDDEN